MPCIPLKIDFLRNLSKFQTPATLLLFFLLSTLGFTQEKRIARLPSTLKEISGLIAINDSILVAINDSGNSPHIHLLDFKGEYLRSITITDATNIDWEDLAYDKTTQTLYIADVGNNLNKRQNLCVYAVPLNYLDADSLKASKIAIQFPNQTAFPPDDKNQLFDCEAMTFYNNALFFVTKCNDKPYTGRYYMYRLDLTSNKIVLCFSGKLGNKGYFYNSITGMDSYNNTFVITTYAGVYCFTLNESNLLEFKKSIKYNRITQKESICYYKNHLYIADEKVPFLLGPNLYKMSFPL